MSKSAGFQVRAFDATTVREPGRTGSVWRLHYSVNPFARLRFLQADRDRGARHRRVGPDPGATTCCRPRLLDCGREIAAGGGSVTVRVNTGSWCWRGRPSVTCSQPWKRCRDRRPARVRTVARSGPPVAGRICRCARPAKDAHAKIRRTAQRKGKQVQPETLRRALRSFSQPTSGEIPSGRSAGVVPPRWQVELVFKRFKGPARAPAEADEASRKLLVAAGRKGGPPAGPFPPGDTTSRPDRTPSPWRDFKFALNQVTRARTGVFPETHVPNGAKSQHPWHNLPGEGPIR